MDDGGNYEEITRVEEKQKCGLKGGFCEQNKMIKVHLSGVSV